MRTGSEPATANGAWLVQRKCGCGGSAGRAGQCDECEQEEVLQRQVSDPSVNSVPPVVNETLSSPGQPLDTQTRAFMESRFSHSFSSLQVHSVTPQKASALTVGAAGDHFEQQADENAKRVNNPANDAIGHSQRRGYDFSEVRVHNDARAAQSAKAVGALAYTVGRHIVFGAGQFSPSTSSGRLLLGHELTHVLQQRGSVVQRTPDPAALKDFDDRVAALRKNPAFIAAAKLADTKQELEEILSKARTRDNATYYIEKLELLFNTPEEKPEAQATQFGQETAKAASDEVTRLATPEGTARAGVEEAVSKDPTRVFSKMEGRAGPDGKRPTFQIDARDVTNIAVQVKVKPVAKGKGTVDDVNHVKQLQDLIEKKASTLGYNVDLDFVDTSGPDVFEVGVDPSDWPTSGNWVKAEALAHELHHLLNLDDLYDYIEAHAGNKLMKIPSRIHWFRVQMDKSPEPEAGKSIMGHSTTGGRNLPSDIDVCRVAGKTNAADLADCVTKRSESRRTMLQPAISMAFGKANRAFELLSNIKPLGPADDPKLIELKQKRAMTMAQNIFGAPMSTTRLKDAVSDMRTAPASPNLFPVSELSADCSRLAFTVPQAPRIRLCPAFFALGTSAQADLLLREAAHFVGESDGASDAACATKDCADTCGSSNNAEAWVKFVNCVSTI